MMKMKDIANEEVSEFGRGLVTCLIKFSEHFNNPLAQKIGSIHFFLSKSDEEQRLILSPNPPAHLTFDREFHECVKFFVEHEVPIWGSAEKAFSYAIELWANGASDHLFELKVPKNFDRKIARKVRELKKLGLTMGHGFTGRIWKWEDFVKLQNFVKEIVLLIDAKLGVEKLDWGRFD